MSSLWDMSSVVTATSLQKNVAGSSGAVVAYNGVAVREQADASA
jgi:hypothetical protein